MLILFLFSPKYQYPRQLGG